MCVYVRAHVWGGVNVCVSVCVGGVNVCARVCVGGGVNVCVQG